MTIEELKVRITADVAQYKQATKQVKNEINTIKKASTSTSSSIKKDADSAASSIKKSTSSAGSAFKSLLSKISVAAAVTALAALGKKAIEVASDLQEVQNVVDVSFGDAASEINDFAETTIKSFGMSELAAKQYASTFMAMSNGMGIAADTGKEVSVNLTKLAADMASFYNVSQDTAATALKSVYTGETETLKKYGIVLTETNLKNYAAAQGIQKEYSEMSEAEKVALRYNYVMQATSNVQGDFSRTSDSWANQIRVLSENWKQLISILGDLLIKVLTPVIQALNTVLEYLTEVGNKLADTLGLTEEDTTSKALTSMDAYTDSVDAATEATEALKKSTAGFDELNKLSNDSSDSSSSETVTINSIDYATYDTATEKTSVLSKAAEKLKEAFAAIGKAFDVSGIISGCQKLIDKFTEVFNTFKSKLDFSEYKGVFKEFFNSAAGYMSTVIQEELSLVGDIFAGTFNAFSDSITTFINKTLPTLTKAMSKTFSTATKEVKGWSTTLKNIFNSSIVPIFEQLDDVLTDVQDTITEVWDERGNALFESIGNALETTRTALESFWNDGIKPILDNIGDTFSWLWEKHLKSFFDKAVEAGAKIVQGLMDIWNTVLKPMVDWVVENILPPIRVVFTTIVSILSSIFAAISDTVGGIFESLGGLIDFIAGVFTGDWKRAWEGIKSMFKGIWDALVGVVKGCVNLIIDIINALWDLVYGAFAAVANTIGSAVSALGDMIGKDWGWEFSKTAPHIPKLATGGIVTQSTLANIGENGSEAVLPLENNTGWMDKLADKFAEKLLNNQPEKLVLNVDGRQLGWAAINNINSITKQTGNLQLSLG